MIDANLIASLALIAKAVPETAETVLSAVQHIKELEATVAHFKDANTVLQEYAAQAENSTTRAEPKRKMTSAEFAERWVTIPAEVEAPTEEGRRLKIETLRYLLAKEYVGDPV